MKINSAFIPLLSFIAAASAASTKRVNCPDGKNSASNKACCAFFPLRDELQSEPFFNKQCGENSHEVLRLAFHDAIGISKSGLRGGGADGSIILFSDTELKDPANDGISDSVTLLSPLLTRHNVTAGDLIQFAAAVAVGNCPGSPKLEFLAGRRNATFPAAQGLVPQAQDSSDKILKRFADAGFSNADVVNLLASHSVARADHVDERIPDSPFDTTPFTFDTQFYLETLLKGTGFPGGHGGANGTGEVSSPLPAEGEIRIQSDFALARDPRTACTWQGFINQQDKMMAAFKDSMSRLAITGHTRSQLIDCSEVVPQPIPPVKKPATYPATKSKADVQVACHSEPFPVLRADPGKATQIPACPNGEKDCSDSDVSDGSS